MKKLITFVVGVFIFSNLYALEKMDECFLVHYGNSHAPLKVTEYMSFSCPHCVKVFQDFPKIKKEFIDTGLLYFTFHPIPKDLTTVRALHCIEMLTDKEKTIFLEALFEYLEEQPEDAQKLCQVMQDFMTCFSKNKLPLDDLAYLKQTPLMEKAFLFLSQENQVKALPTVEINGVFFPSEIPNYAFFAEAVQAVIGDENE